MSHKYICVPSLARCHFNKWFFLLIVWTQYDVDGPMAFNGAFNISADKNAKSFSLYIFIDSRWHTKCYFLLRKYWAPADERFIRSEIQSSNITTFYDKQIFIVHSLWVGRISQKLKLYSSFTSFAPSLNYSECMWASEWTSVCVCVYVCVRCTAVPAFAYVWHGKHAPFVRHLYM